MSGATRPKQGGRVELVLEACDEQRAAYQMTLLTASGEWTGRASVAIADGATQVDAEAGEGEGPPRWLTDFVRQLLRTLWNARRGEGATPWPGRVTRWRDERAPSA
jgi:hypothetical protein